MFETLILIAVATERAVSIAVPYLKIEKTEYKQGLAALIGAVAYTYSPIPELEQVFKQLTPVIVGFAVSGGSGIWYDIQKAIK